MSCNELPEAGCPSCRAKQDILIWKSISVNGDPEIKEQLFTGRINYFSCKNCDFEGFITAPLVYDDQEMEIRVNYVPAGYPEDEEYLKESFTPDAKIRPGPDAGNARTGGPDYFHDAHIVFSMAEMIRYILFRDRPDQVSAGTGPE